MRGILKNNGFYVLLLSFVFALVSYLFVAEVFRSVQLQIIRLTQIYALAAVGCLYLVMLPSPLSAFLSGTIIREWKDVRLYLGIAAFFFALLHSLYAFFGQLGGFFGLLFLSNYYLVGITFSFISLLSLSFFAVLSSIWISKRIKFRESKLVHYLLYIAGLFILIHALLLGTHFHDLSEFIPVFMFVFVAFLLLLHAMNWEKRIAHSPRFGFISISVFVLMVITYFWYLNPGAGSDTSSPLSVHSQHTNTGNTVSNESRKPLNSYMPGMEGDRGKKFNVEFLHPDILNKEKQTKLDFRISDATNGDPVYFFQTPFEKPFHLIIVNSDLSYFSHIHPVQEKNIFSIETAFPKDDIYHIYNDFQPFGAIEQQFGFQVNVGDSELKQKNEVQVDFGQEKSVGDYIVKLAYDMPLSSEKISVGDQELKFSVFNKDNSPVTTLHPYLGAFGHLVMIKKDTFEYVHAHPVMTKPVLANERSGPTVTFVPMAIYSKVLPGVYKVFAQFNPNGTVITSEFWIEVK